MTLELTTKDDQKVGILKNKIEKHILEMKSAPESGRERLQDMIFQFVREILRTPEGVKEMYLLIPDLTEAGFFKGGAWEHPDRLMAHLVRGALMANGVYPLVESLSELRILAIFEGKVKSDRMTPDEAHEFLIEVLALNLDLLFGSATEEGRIKEKSFHQAKGLFEFISQKINMAELFDEFLQEIKELTGQRPIVTRHILEMVRAGKNLVDENSEVEGKPEHAEFMNFYRAAFVPTELAENYPSAFDSYRDQLAKLSEAEIGDEARAMGERLRTTGLCGDHGTVLLRFISKRYPHFVPECLGLNDSGVAVYEKHQEFVQKIIRLSIRPSTSYTIYGLARFLERHLLSQDAILRGIEKLVEMDILPEVKEKLLKLKRDGDSLTANAFLVSGIVSVLGQPLGIGQGNNPTCQSARGLSLWSQYDPGYLIDLLVSATRDGVVEVGFEGQVLKSTNFPKVLAKDFDPHLDPVSLILSPHLDALYNAIMSMVGFRGEDGHKWANPALYGRWIHFGFESVLDFSQQYVTDFSNFVRRFYSTHHPQYNDEHPIQYANPVGIFVTNAHAELMGLHAVSIQRVDVDDEDNYRVYFFNPNNEGRQNWGQGIRPSVFGHGERPGESSLPFAEFTSRLYAYHFNPYEEGDGFAVPTDEVEKVVNLAKKSWGKSYTWMI